MGKNSTIEWTHHTFNPWWGCLKVSPGCKHCYAETFAKRIGLSLWGGRSERRFFGDAHWREPLKWNTEAIARGVRGRVFCASMADVFEPRRELDLWRARLWALIEATPSLDWLLLTKRPEQIAGKVPWKKDWPQNVWLGTTAENQLWADRRIPELVKHPAAVRFLSCEPLLGPLNLNRWMGGRQGSCVDWIIAGGESGHKARPMHPDWVRSLRDQCASAGVAFHFKQWGQWRPELVESKISYVRLGKQAAGRDLDGRTWDELPWCHVPTVQVAVG